MQVKAKQRLTPAGVLRAPFDPSFASMLSECDTIEQLFALVENNGFINPDAINEVIRLGLYGEYRAWKHPAQTNNTFLSDMVSEMNARK